jgi:hypothetical protein
MTTFAPTGQPVPDGKPVIAVNATADYCNAVKHGATVQPIPELPALRHIRNPSLSR